MKKTFGLFFALIALSSIISGQAYVYDNLNRVTKVTYPNNTYQTFAYDANGNRISETATASPCPSSQTNFYAGTAITANTYQWQVDQGSGYTNIINDNIYTGATSPVLNLSAAPTSWYGRKYRCVVTGPEGTTNSSESTLKFSLTWTGTKSIAWEDPLNWNCAGVPDAYTDVIINGNTTNLPTISFPAACKSLTLGQGTILNLQGNQLLDIGMPPSVRDIDGNSYPIVTICTKQWIAKNLEVTRYRNGDPIPQVQDPTVWNSLSTGAWCYYQNNTANGIVYGKLYNWYAVNDPRGLAPQGWHIPTNAEWISMSDTCLGGSAIASDKMKTTGTVLAGTGLWQGGYNNSTNSTGFSGLPAGSRIPTGSFVNIGFAGIWWTATQLNATDAAYREADMEISDLSYGTYNKKLGISVRCVKD